MSDKRGRGSGKSLSLFRLWCGHCLRGLGGDAVCVFFIFICLSGLFFIFILLGLLWRFVLFLSFCHLRLYKHDLTIGLSLCTLHFALCTLRFCPSFSYSGSFSLFLAWFFLGLHLFGAVWVCCVCMCVLCMANSKKKGHFFTGTASWMMLIGWGCVNILQQRCLAREGEKPLLSLPLVCTARSHCPHSGWWHAPRAHAPFCCSRCEL